MQYKNLTAFLLIGALTTGLSACADPFDHTVFRDEHYGPWRSSLGSDNIPCYGRESQVKEACGTHIKIERAFKKDPRSALTPYVMAQLEQYVANADQGTAATFQAGGIIYRLRFASPRPTQQTVGQLCRHVGLQVKPARSSLPWHDMSGEYCF